MVGGRGPVRGVPAGAGLALAGGRLTGGFGEALGEGDAVGEADGEADGLGFGDGVGLGVLIFALKLEFRL